MMTQLQPVKIRLISLFDEELARKMSLDECSWSSVSHVLPCVSVYQWMFTPICERWTGAQACMCVCVLPLRVSWCVCMCEQASFCLWVCMKTSSSPPVWVWSGCSVCVNVAPVCCNPVVWASHAPSVKEAQPSSLTHTRPWSSSHLHFLLFFNHPFCQLLLRFSVSSKQYVKRVCLN